MVDLIPVQYIAAQVSTQDELLRGVVGNDGTNLWLYEGELWVGPWLCLYTTLVLGGVVETRPKNKNPPIPTKLGDIVGLVLTKI